MENTQTSALESLKSSEYKIDENEANILGWEVKNEASLQIGIVDDLLFDSLTKDIRYLIITLTATNLEAKKVMIPIGIAQLHETKPEVILPNIQIDQFNALPSFDGNLPSNDTEQLVRQIIGSPAALRIEETIAELDQQNFYNHHHFNPTSFYQNRNLSSKSFTDRGAQKETIHELIENSKQNDLHAADDHTGENSHHNEGKHIDLKEQKREI